MTMQSVSSDRSVSTRENVLVVPRLSPRRWLETLRLWRARAQARRELARLSALDLKDIGYPAEVEAEKRKPFWRA